MTRTRRIKKNNFEIFFFGFGLSGLGPYSFFPEAALKSFSRWSPKTKRGLNIIIMERNRTIVEAELTTIVTMTIVEKR